MALHETDLFMNARASSVSAKLKEIEQMTEQPNKPFRRKAALQAESRAQASTGTALQPVAPHNLPIRLPEPWERLRKIEFGQDTGNSKRSPALVNYYRDSETSKAFDQLRTGLLRTLRERGWKTVAIAGPTRGCGATFTAVNLALSLARVPESRTLLVDMNMRDPGVRDAMHLDVPGNMRSFLKEEEALEKYVLRCGETLALALSDSGAPDAAEMLHAEMSRDALETMVSDLAPDVVLYDLPAVLEYDDMAAFCQQVDAVLLVADATQTTAAQIRASERTMGDNVPLLGVVLNRGDAKQAAGAR